MKLYFENCQGKRRLIGEPETRSAADEIIRAFCEERNFHIYYIRNWVQNGELVYDVGSWTEFFILSGSNIKLKE